MSANIFGKHLTIFFIFKLFVNKAKTGKKIESI